MHPTLQEAQAAADTLFYEAEAGGGFLKRLVQDREFDTAGWQRIWIALASLLQQHHGTLDPWEAYDLARIISSVQQAGQALVGRPDSSLDGFENQVIEANNMLTEMLV